METMYYSIGLNSRIMTVAQRISLEFAFEIGRIVFNFRSGEDAKIVHWPYSRILHITHSMLDLAMLCDAMR